MNTFSVLILSLGIFTYSGSFAGAQKLPPGSYQKLCTSCTVKIDPRLKYRNKTPLSRLFCKCKRCARTEGSWGKVTKCVEYGPRIDTQLNYIFLNNDAYNLSRNHRELTKCFDIEVEFSGNLLCQFYSTPRP